MTKQNKHKRNGIIAICIGTLAIIAIIITVVVLAVNRSNIDESYFVDSDDKYVYTYKEGEFVDDDNTGIDTIHNVYYYSGDNITGSKTFYKYKSTNEAKTAYDKFVEEKESGDENTFKNVELDGDYVIITYDESTYEGLTAEDIKSQFEFMRSENQSNTNESETTNENTEEVVEEVVEEVNVNSVPEDTPSNEPTVEENNV